MRFAPKFHRKEHSKFMKLIKDVDVAIAKSFIEVCVFLRKRFASTISARYFVVKKELSGNGLLSKAVLCAHGGMGLSASVLGLACDTTFSMLVDAKPLRKALVAYYSTFRNRAIIYCVFM